MNHDNAHCANYRPDCPRSCYRANLTREYKALPPGVTFPVTWAAFFGTKECLRKDRERSVDI